MMVKEECKPISIKMLCEGFVGMFMFRKIEAESNVKVPVIMVEYGRRGDACVALLNGCSAPTEEWRPFLEYLLPHVNTSALFFD